MSSNSKSQIKIQTQDKVEDMPAEIEFLRKFRCVERKEENQERKKDYIVYNCDGFMKINKDNIREVIEEALNTATQLNAVIRIFRVLQYDTAHTVSITVTRGGLISFEIRFPQRVGGYQNVLTIRVEEVNALKQLADKLAEIVQNLIL